MLASGSALACDDTKSAASFTIGQSKCYACHNSVHKNGGIAFFTSGTKAALPITEANRHAAYCAVSSDDMPQDGPLGLDDKQNVLCWLHPTTEATPNCGGTAPPPGAGFADAYAAGGYAGRASPAGIDANLTRI